MGDYCGSAAWPLVHMRLSFCEFCRGNSGRLVGSLDMERVYEMSRIFFAVLCVAWAVLLGLMGWAAHTHDFAQMSVYIIPEIIITIMIVFHHDE